MAKAEYKRLTRARARSSFAVALLSRTSLWLGADHLLLVDSNGYTETYKRFYFRDIQTFVVQKTQVATVVNIVLTILFVLVTTLGIALETTGLKIFFFSLAGIFLLLLLANLLQGRTCRCFLRTAVQIEQLPSLARVRQTRKVLKKIRPLIATAQGGELSPETISEMMRQQVGSSAINPAPPAENPDLPPRLDF